MKIEPRDLGMPFPPRHWFGVRALAVILLASGALAWLYPSFGFPYFLTALFALPLLGSWLLSARVSRWYDSLGLFSRFLMLALLFIYLKLVKTFLVPALLEKKRRRQYLTRHSTRTPQQEHAALRYVLRAD